VYTHTYTFQHARAQTHTHTQEAEYANDTNSHTLFQTSVQIRTPIPCRFGFILILLDE